jgi:hypothetical protein
MKEDSLACKELQAELIMSKISSRNGFRKPSNDNITTIIKAGVSNL